MSEIDEQAEGEATNPTEDEEPTTESDEEVEEVDGDSEETVALKARLDELEATNKHLVARAKKAERKPKGKRTDLETPDVPTSENVDERILMSQGMNAETLKELKRVARFNETDLITAQADPMFVAIKDKLEQEQRNKEASLGASKGSGAGKTKKTFQTSALKQADHKKMWQAAQK